ncbi:MAG: acyl-[acyl-carrier-protein] thioesterase [Acutalibacteraceae bacterium]|jgi:medium-chain acyl-[acyl-carrier-protein] hydrolase
MAWQVADRHEEPVLIESYMTDPDRRLRPSALLRLHQEAAERHFGAAGLGSEALAGMGLVFVMTRLNAVIRRLPTAGETVRVQTWHRDVKGVSFFRCYRLVDGAGAPLTETVAALSLVDPVEHKLLRPSAFDRFGIPDQTRSVEHCPDPARLRLPDGLVDAGAHVVRWSQLDYNRHLNHAYYVDLLCDYAPGGMAGRAVTGFSVGYHREARPGQTLALTALDTGDAVWMRGEHEGGLCFEGKLTFAAAK